MFLLAVAFNQSLTGFDTSRVTDMSFMFFGAAAFNQPLTGFDTSRVTRMVGMFDGAAAFNGAGLVDWNTTQVTTTIGWCKLKLYEI
jgi:surface protein